MQVMPWRENLYSRIVAWLKVLLPLAALGVLMSLFLLSRTINPTAEIPFATGDFSKRASGEQVTAPEFSGVTEEGHKIVFRAAAARPGKGNGGAEAENLSARIDLAAGGEITFQANGGTIDARASLAELSGAVVVRSSQGYVIHTDKLVSHMRIVRAETPGQIDGEGPPGRFTAGRMLVTQQPGEAVHLLFTEGVKLIYDPRQTRE